MAALTLTNAPIHPFSIPQLTLTNDCIDPFQFSHWAPIVVQYPHWPWPTPPLPFELTLTNAPTDPFQYLHWLWPMPPLTLFNATIDPFSIDPDECPQWPYTIAPGFFQCPHWPFSILPLDIFKAPIENVQRPNWNFSTPPLKFFNTPQTQPDTPQIRLDTPQIRLDTYQIRLDTTLSDKSKWIRTKFDWIRPLPPPKASNRRHWGFTSVQAVSWKTNATIATNPTKPQPNQSRKNCNITSGR